MKTSSPLVRGFSLAILQSVKGSGALNSKTPCTPLVNNIHCFPVAFNHVAINFSTFKLNYYLIQLTWCNEHKRPQTQVIINYCIATKKHKYIKPGNINAFSCVMGRIIQLKITKTCIIGASIKQIIKTTDLVFSFKYKVLAIWYTIAAIWYIIVATIYIIAAK